MILLTGMNTLINEFRGKAIGKNVKPKDFHGINCEFDYYSSYLSRMFYHLLVIYI